MISNLVVSIVIIILTGLVSLILGSEGAGWDGAAWHGGEQQTA
jgi:hypothetical protein